MYPRNQPRSARDACKRHNLVRAFWVFADDSIVNNTYLDVSNLLFIALPDHLYATDYFASKKDLLNFYFTKKLWACIAAAFLILFSASRCANPLSHPQFVLGTSTWLAFTA